ncbi:erythromycin esterase family protein [Pontibacter harenae]|uniref:erythromycin esterase family protein n=1 Tax=Pontibacter harenae TaxID=2894083 RepID=UPI001E5D5E76|nr:erythromycin esterase family protein [Pontibacter harenae]MCC9167505.1 erythromycin esterase family protein [Pontibacter harenae]
MKKIQLLWVMLFLLFTACSEEDSDTIGNEAGVEIPASAITKLETAQDLNMLLQNIGDAQYVLLGEASHGTSEFYTWRAEITKRLIQEKGFTLIGVEGDWPDAYEVNRYVRGNSNANSAREALQAFNRWPTWMWANTEIEDLTEWLRAYNTQNPSDMVGFYGLDVYSLWESMEEVQRYLNQTDLNAAQAASAALQCFAPYNRNESAYAAATLNSGANCTDELEQLLEVVQERVAASPARDEEAFNAIQNARAALNSERYFRASARSSSNSWNIRDRHMMETINQLVEQHGLDAKIVVWEHNTHVGDARYTDMADAGMVNVGQLVREEHGQGNSYIVGFGTYEGTVIAAQAWGSPLIEMRIPEAQPGSWEAILQRHQPEDKIVLLEGLRQDQKFLQRRGHRAIGVSYNPSNEQGNYVPTVLPMRYDAFIFIEETTALHPL